MSGTPPSSNPSPIEGEGRDQPSASKVRDEISPLHPALAGHFPGNPIVPGVLILRRVCRAVAGASGAAVAAVPVVRFHAPLRPAEPFDIGFEPRRGERVGFRVVRGETLIASGTVHLSGK